MGVLHGAQALAQGDGLCLQESAVDACNGTSQGDVDGRGSLPEVVVQPAARLVTEDVVHGEEVLVLGLGGAHLVGNLGSDSEAHCVLVGTARGWGTKEWIGRGFNFFSWGSKRLGVRRGTMQKSLLALSLVAFGFCCLCLLRCWPSLLTGRAQQTHALPG